MPRSALTSGVRYLHDLVVSQRYREQSDEQLLHAFVADRDESAFAALVRRHGPMVLHVCRRVLGHEQDAEDAFQATFLVLARNAGTLRKKTALASFLHGTAYRLALNGKRAVARRRKHESQTPSRPPRDLTDELSWREVRTLLDEEIAQLPDGLRSVSILCCLENLSRREAAERLGLKERTLMSRLATARKRLGKRLARRGVELTALLAAAALADAPLLALPLVPLRSIGRATVSPAVAALAESISPLMGLSKAKVMTVFALAVSLVGGAAGWFLGSHSAIDPGERRGVSPPIAATTNGPTPRRSPDKAPTVEVRGRVLDPDGKPVRGAKLLFLWRHEKLPNKVWAVSGADGRFVFAVARSPAANSAWEVPGERPYVLAAAEDYGFAVTRLADPESATNPTLRLVKNNVPIQGRILDLQGKPVSGARVGVNDLEPRNEAQLYVPKGNDLADWLAALKTIKEDPWNVERTYLTALSSQAFPLLFPPVTTGEDGRFQLRGIGRDRLVHLRIEGPTIATEVVNVMTRSSDPVRLPLSRNYPKGESITYHGATFEILAAPTKPVMGVVRDRDTGKPLAGVTIKPNKITNPFGISNHNKGLMQTTTDKDGRYRLIGLPKGEDNQLLATTDDLPYLPWSRTVENTPGLGPVTVDFALKRGIWVKGRVTDKATGKPLEGGVGYYCFQDNPHHKDIPRQVFIHGRRTREDGSYRFVVVPGRGLIAVQVAHNDRYLSGVGAEKIKAPHVDFGIDCFDTYPLPCQIPNCSTLVEIDPKPEDGTITCDLTVVPGRSLKGTVLGPDGKPLTGARRNRWDTLSSSEFTVWGLPANKLREPRVIEFVHEGKKLAGFLTVYGDEKEPLQVRCQPWGVLTGRLVTPHGEPLTGVAVSCDAGETHPDKQGRFRIEGLTPGLKYNLYVSKEGLILNLIGGEPKNLMVKPGETLDLGVLQVKQQE